MAELNLCASYSAHNKAEFIVDAVLFDMDGTLVDSIPAIESAWAAVAKKIQRDPDEVIEETHGRRVMDNLKDLYPHLRKMSDADMQPHVKEFEIEILRQADEYGVEVKSRRSSAASSKRASRAASFVANGEPSDANKPRRKSNLSNSITAEGVASRMAAMGIKPLSTADKHVPEANAAEKKSSALDASAAEDVFEDELSDTELEIDVSDLVDRSVRILPGVRRLTDSLPIDRFAIATSAAVTHCHGALQRVGISLPKVTVTADDPRLKRGKPFPDPFILAAETLGFEPKNCLVVEDSPFGIQAGVAAGGKTIAVSTSHSHDKISHCGATWLVPTLDLVQAETLPDGRIRIFIDATATQVEKAISESVRGKIAAQLV
ncbi:HAD-like domain-containing protein [Melampsora americana]|nr:HAD-like domain-containing protein [Melampsora americana]